MLNYTTRLHIRRKCTEYRNSCGEQPPTLQGFRDYLNSRITDPAIIADVKANRGSYKQLLEKLFPVHPNQQKIEC